MNLQGNIADFPMYEVVQLIAMGRRSGKLHLDGEIDKLIIYFIEGEAVFAQPIFNKDKLGNVLLSNGYISKEHINSALRMQSIYTERGSNKRLGTILVDLGVLSRTTLEEYLKRQIKDAVYAILTEKEGVFSFTDELDLDEEDILVPMNVERIIQNGIRIVEERKRVKHSMPSMSAIYERIKLPEDESELELDYPDWKVLSLVDGERTIEDIIIQTGYSPIMVIKTLTTFSDRGVIASRE